MVMGAPGRSAGTREATSGASSSAAGAAELMGCCSAELGELGPWAACWAARSSCAFFKASWMRLMASFLTLPAIQFLDPGGQDDQLNLQDSGAVIAPAER